MSWKIFQVVNHAAQLSFKVRSPNSTSNEAVEMYTDDDLPMCLEIGDVLEITAKPEGMEMLLYRKK